MAYDYDGDYDGGRDADSDSARDGGGDRDGDEKRKPIERITLAAPLAERPPGAACPHDPRAVRHRTVRDAEREIAELFGRQMPAVDRDILVVDNARPRHAVEEREDRTIVIGGDNSAREFSAFDRAIEFTGSRIWSYDLVHFATSAFNRLYVAYLDRFNTRLLEALIDRAVCVGHIDCYNEPVDVLTLSLAALDPFLLLLHAAGGGARAGQFRVGERPGAVLQRRSRRAVPRGCADQPSLSRIHHALAHRRRHRAGRRVALAIRAHSRDAAGVRADDDARLELSAARHPAARDGLPGGRRTWLYDHAAASRAARHRVEHAVAVRRQSRPRRGRAGGDASSSGEISSWTPGGLGTPASAQPRRRGHGSTRRPLNPWHRGGVNHMSAPGFSRTSRTADDDGLRPPVFVERGSHSGISRVGFAQAVETRELPASTRVDRALVSLRAAPGGRV